MTRRVSHEQTRDQAGLSYRRAHDQAGLSPTGSRPGGSLIVERWEQGGASLVVWVRVAVKFALFRHDRDVTSTRWWRCPEMRLSAVTRLV